MTGRFAQVALPLPLASSYTYRIPETLGDRVVPGARVVVPVRRRELIGIVVDADAAPPAAAARDLLAAPDVETAIPEGLLETARWIAGYYGAPLGLTLKSMLPGGMWGASQVVAALVGTGRLPGGIAGEVAAWLQRRGGEGAVSAAARALRRPVWDAFDRLARIGAVALRVEPPDTDAAAATERVAALAGDPPTLLERGALFRRAPRQRRLYEALEQLGGSALVRHVTGQLGFSPAVLRALEQRGLVRLARAERVRDPFADLPGAPPPAVLTDDQRAALAALQALGPGEGAVLFGVTGSGKTLVYLEAVRRVLAAGRGAIVLVPEIGLTPQTVSRLRGAFGDEVAVLHSALSDGERADAWRLLRRGERRVAVGARSAIFAPVANLGMIVLDEEHEASYKNGEAPRYHARDVAAVRARIEGASLVLGSATPSLETMALVERRLRLLRLPERVGSRPLPAVELVDLRVAPKVSGTGAVTWSEALDAAIVGTLARGSRRSCCSTGAASPPSCNAPTAAKCGSARAAASRSRSTPPRPGSAATTAATRSRCPIPAAPAPVRCSRCGASAPNSWSGFSPSGIRRLGWRAWTWTRPAPSGPTIASWPRWRPARSTCCSARR